MHTTLSSDPPRGAIRRLQDWYSRQANGTWEHSHGIKIETLDNPGWSVTLDLADTPHRDRPFAEVSQNYEHDTDWFECRKVGHTITGHGGPEQLEAILTHILDWLETPDP